MKILLFAFIISINLLTYGQDYNKVTYEIKIDKSKLSKFMTEKKFDQLNQTFMFKMVDGANASRLILRFDKNASLNTLDEGMSFGNNNTQFARGVLTFLDVENDLFFNNTSKIFYEKRGRDDFPHLVKINPNDFNWQIKKSTKSVGKLNYRKAVSTFYINNIKHNVEAWFCTTFPVHYGPGFFYGLPGLITEVYVTSSKSEFDYSFIMKSIDFEKNIGNIEPPLTTLNVLTEEESQKLFAKGNEMFEN